MTEVFGLERMVLHLLPDERLLSKAWSIRDAYRRLVPDDMYRKYEESSPPELWRDPVKHIDAEFKSDDTQDDVQQKVVEHYKEYLSEVRADAEDLLSATHWWYTNSNYREERIQRVKQKLIFLLFIFLIALIPISLSRVAMPSTMLATVALMGMMGAIFSIARRILPVSIQDITQSDPIIRATQFDHGGTGIVLSIYTGGISAVVLYILMGTGLNKIGGDLMPTLASTCLLHNNELPSLNDFFDSLMPSDTASFAKVLCWSFLAGFAEKFVPDILDRMAKKNK